MNIITSAGSAAAAVATQVRGEKRAANIVTSPGTLTVWGGGNWGRPRKIKREEAAAMEDY